MISIFDIMQRSKKSYTHALEKVCRKWELTQNELDVLLFLANNPEYHRAAEIVERRGIAKSHVSLAVQNLTARALLEQRNDLRDRRTAYLHLTDAAHPIVREGQHLQKEYFTKLFAGLTKKELTVFESVLTRVGENIDTLEA